MRVLAPSRTRSKPAFMSSSALALYFAISPSFCLGLVALGAQFLELNFIFDLRIGLGLIGLIGLGLQFSDICIPLIDASLGFFDILCAFGHDGLLWIATTFCVPVPGCAFTWPSH